MLVTRRAGVPRRCLDPPGLCVFVDARPACASRNRVPPSADGYMWELCNCSFLTEYCFAERYAPSKKTSKNASGAAGAHADGVDAYHEGNLSPPVVSIATVSARLIQRAFRARERVAHFESVVDGIDEGALGPPATEVDAEKWGKLMLRRMVYGDLTQCATRPYPGTRQGRIPCSIKTQLQDACLRDGKDDRHLTGDTPPPPPGRPRRPLPGGARARRCVSEEELRGLLLAAGNHVPTCMLLVAKRAKERGHPFQPPSYFRSKDLKDVKYRPPVVRLSTGGAGGKKKA